MQTCTSKMNQISKLTLMFLVAILLFSIIFANFAHQIDLELNSDAKLKHDLGQNFKLNQENVTIIDDSPSNLMWFIQVSDLHLSLFQDQMRIKELQEFCCSTVDIIKPSVILASGDLTDAKHKDNMGSAQYKGEWIAYADILNKCDIRRKTFWLDIRGNHDNFNVPGWKSSLNYFNDYSVQGPTNPRSYMHIIEKGAEKYAFLALDACLDPGPKRPFNFIGMLSSDNVQEVKQLLKKADEMKVDHMIWFGHYPTSCILSLSDSSLKTMIGDVESSKAYLCGHLHQMGGIVTNMYTLQKPGFLELELGDWKDNRMFRVAAIDHGLFSFTDIRHGNWPIILITNPKHALFVMPSREPLLSIRFSTHIRLLAFSVSPITSVEVKLGSGNWETCDHVEGPLYAMKWNPSNFETGIHMIYARVKDQHGRVNAVEQPFSLDGTKMSFNILAKVVLMIDASKIFQCLFGTMLILCTLPLITLRYFHKKIMCGKMEMIKTKRNFAYHWMRKMWILSTVDRIFYPLIFYEIYLCFGPWSVGEIMDGYIGTVFAWGIFVKGAFLPGSFTYMYGFLQLFVCQFPLTLFLANSVDKRFYEHWCGKPESRYLFVRLCFQIPFLLILSMNMLFAYFFWLAYGTISFILGPLRTWSIFLNLYLWYQAISLSPKSTRDAAKLWSTNKHLTRNNPDFPGSHNS